MPELPEVEVTRLSLVDRITGARIESASVGKPLRWPLGCQPAQLSGQTVLGLRRRGKYLLMDLDNGLLLWHLGMSGSLSFGFEHRLAGKHDHFELVTNRGILRLNDPRRFGAVVHAVDEASPAARKLLGGLGVEPLGSDFDPVLFHRQLRKRGAAIKQVLLAGDTVVGVGNIYASEALYMAGIRPTTRAARITLPRARRLHAAIQQVLNAAVQQGGSTLRDFTNAQGQGGYFQLQAMVYGRAGQPCRVCGGTVKGIRQGQRATFYCPQCQKP